jgi:hypothetical protein
MKDQRKKKKEKRKKKKEKEISGAVIAIPACRGCFVAIAPRNDNGDAVIAIPAWREKQSHSVGVGLPRRCAPRNDSEE